MAFVVKRDTMKQRPSTNSVFAMLRDVAFGVAVALLGFAVARHNALVEGRVIEADLLYVFLTVGSLTTLAVLLAELLYRGGHVYSIVTLALVMTVTISALMLYDGVRTALDRLFYRDQFQQLRANLRRMANEAGTGLSLSEQLEAVLIRLCATLTVEQGMIALARGDGSGVFVVEASQGATPAGTEVPQVPLLSDEIVVRSPNARHAPGHGGAGTWRGLERDWIALLAPIVFGGSQVGALALGPKAAGQPYEDEDLMLLDDVADQITAVIRTARLQEENARAINAMVSEFRERERDIQRQVQEMLDTRSMSAQPGSRSESAVGLSQQEFVSQVEEALRHLHDYPALGNHPLAQLTIVRQTVASAPGAAQTHIDRGKALSKVVVQALDKLRPEGVPPNPHAVPPHEWRQFIVLHDSYVLGELHRDIMSKLYIGEGTFNRTRRCAIQGVARALQEMEQEAGGGEGGRQVDR
jgi:hypothetical protein